MQGRFTGLQQAKDYAEILGLNFAYSTNGKGIERLLPEGRKQYTKTQPLQFEEFADCLNWWKHRKENDRAWKVSAAELLVNNCNLDRKNPRCKEDITHLPPEQLVESILQKEQRIMEIMGRIRETVMKQTTGNVVLYKAPDGSISLDVTLRDETVWLNLNQMAQLFDRDKSVISRHLRNVFLEKELERKSVVAKKSGRLGKFKERERFE